MQTAPLASDTASPAADISGAELLALCREGLHAAEALLDLSRKRLGVLVLRDGRVDMERLEAEQLAAHGLAWQATYVETLRQTLAWAESLAGDGRLTSVEADILRLGFAEYLGQLFGGIALSQVESVRPADLRISAEELAAIAGRAPLARLAEPEALAALRMRLAEAAGEGRLGEATPGDDTLDMMREQFERFAAAEVAPLAQQIHAEDALIPLELIGKMSEAGVFAATIPEEHGGLGLGKSAMCLISEVLSRAYLGVGSLGTRAEIAGELIRLAGTDAQKARWLPKLASGEILPTAVFTEPNTGSDLANLRTRAVREGDVYKVYGAKTWITHGARSDLMTLLVRTGTPEEGARGVSMLLAEKPRGSEADPFPAKGMSGTEIEVIGYRGMKEYEIAFDGFEVPVENLLGGVEGQGFKQLMATFESARIQTAARAVGVAQNALDLGLAYAKERVQFAKPLIRFPRVHGKLAWMAAETMMARQLTYFAAREKDSDRRTDMQAGMAKLLAARVAFANADAALQIHGGNGYSTEYAISRVLCDARILSIFEGAVEIQAQVIARGLLTGRN